MAYLDTSIIVSYYCPEPLSEKADRVITQEHEPIISSLTSVEFVSALSRKIREKEIAIVDAGKIWDQFKLHRSQGYYIEKTLESDHYTLAAELIARFKTPLRTLDALHCSVASKSGVTLITSDIHLAHSCEKFDIPVTLVR